MDSFNRPDAPEQHIKRIVLHRMDRCAVCHHEFELDDIRVLSRKPDMWMMLVECTDCHARNFVAAVLNEMAPDDRTALLEELPGTVTKQLIDLLTPDERRIATQLLGYAESSIGRMMTPDYVAFRAVSVLGSGPTGGVMGATHVAGMAGVKNFIAGDMGGPQFWYQPGVYEQVKDLYDGMAAHAVNREAARHRRASGGNPISRRAVAAPISRRSTRARKAAPDVNPAIATERSVPSENMASALASSRTAARTARPVSIPPTL